MHHHSRLSGWARPGTLLLAALLLLAFLPGAALHAEENGKGESKEAKDVEDKKDQDEEKPFAEMVEGCDVIEGLFTLYHDPEENKTWLEVRPEQLGHIYLCSVVRSAGDGMYFDSGALVDNFPFVLERVGKKIRMLRKNVYYRADAPSPLAEAVERGVTNSLFASAKVESQPHPDRGSILVDAATIFVRDHSGVAASFSDNENVKYSFDAGESYITTLKSFPLNTEIEVLAHFTTDKITPTDARIPDSRSMMHRYWFSLMELPESDYVPRLADDRVGHFVTMYQDFSDLTGETPYVWYVKRWNIRKKNPKDKSSPAAKPVVFWLDNTVPKQYRDAVREGVLLWNDAFERIGIRDAIQVKQMPDDADWDPSDARYNVIRWIVMPGGTYAVGPSHANPFTGEIYSADVRLSADFVRYFFRTYEEYIHPLTAMSKGLPEMEARPHPGDYCDVTTGKAMEGAFGMDVLAARGWTDPDSPEVKKFVHDGIVDVVAHEVGHTLGLRHNFDASAAFTLDECQDKERTAKEGVSASLMDYNAVNLAGPGRKQGDYWNSKPGVYDFWAIEYAYSDFGATSPEKEVDALEKIAARCGEPHMAYATDEDAYGYTFQGVDPYANLWDMGDDPIAFFEERVALAGELIGDLDRELHRDGLRYPRIRTIFSRSLRQYAYAAATVSKYVGGLRVHRVHMGDAGDRLPLEPVDAAEQRRALAFLDRHIFGAGAFQYPPALLNQLAPERRVDFDFSIYYQPRVDYPLHDVVLGIQKSALNRLYHPITLGRLVDHPLYLAEADDRFTMEEMFRSLRGMIWSELDSGAAIGSFRRNLQREHLERLVRLVVKPMEAPYFSPASDSKPAGQIAPPEDATTFARADLVALLGGIDRRLAAGSADPATAAHLQESRARIVAALDAGLERQL